MSRNDPSMDMDNTVPDSVHVAVTNEELLLYDRLCVVYKVMCRRSLDDAVLVPSDKVAAS